MQQANASDNLIGLGTAQDGGYPHTGCSEDCCREAWKDSNQKRLIASLAVLDGKDCFLIDITPDFKYQLQLIEQHINEKPRISGICITHAHLGHYMGLHFRHDINRDIIRIHHFKTKFQKSHIMP